jgi:hypothetical protein
MISVFRYILVGVLLFFSGLLLAKEEPTTKEEILALAEKMLAERIQKNERLIQLGLFNQLDYVIDMYETLNGNSTIFTNSTKQNINTKLSSVFKSGINTRNENDKIKSYLIIMLPGFYYGVTGIDDAKEKNAENELQQKGLAGGSKISIAAAYQNMLISVLMLQGNVVESSPGSGEFVTHNSPYVYGSTAMLGYLKFNLYNQWLDNYATLAVPGSNRNAYLTTTVDKYIELVQSVPGRFGPSFLAGKFLSGINSEQYKNDSEKYKLINDIAAELDKINPVLDQDYGTIVESDLSPIEKIFYLEKQKITVENLTRYLEYLRNNQKGADQINADVAALNESDDSALRGYSRFIQLRFADGLSWANREKLLRAWAKAKNLADNGWLGYDETKVIELIVKTPIDDIPKLIKLFKDNPSILNTFYRNLDDFGGTANNSKFIRSLVEVGNILIEKEFTNLTDEEKWTKLFTLQADKKIAAILIRQVGLPQAFSYQSISYNAKSPSEYEITCTFCVPFYSSYLERYECRPEYPVFMGSISPLDYVVIIEAFEFKTLAPESFFNQVFNIEVVPAIKFLYDTKEKNVKTAVAVGSTALSVASIALPGLALFRAVQARNVMLGIVAGLELTTSAATELMATQAFKNAMANKSQPQKESIQAVIVALSVIQLQMNSVDKIWNASRTAQASDEVINLSKTNLTDKNIGEYMDFVADAEKNNLLPANDLKVLKNKRDYLQKELNREGRVIANEGGNSIVNSKYPIEGFRDAALKWTGERAYRFKKADLFYQSNKPEGTYLSQIDDELRATDFDRPVLDAVFKKDDYVYQWVYPKRGTIDEFTMDNVGSYFTKDATAQPEVLGIPRDNRVLRKFRVTQDMEALETYSSDVLWRGRDVVYTGGGKQFFRPNAKPNLEFIDDTKVLVNKAGSVLGSIVKNGNKIEYTNPAGKLLKWSEQTAGDISNSINAARNSTDVGRKLEGTVADFIKQEGKTIEGFGVKVKDGIKNTDVTDIDILTKNEIIEVKNSVAAWEKKSNQINRFVSSSLDDFVNPYNKKAILYIEQPLSALDKQKILNTIPQNVTLVNSLQELKAVLK